MASTINASTSGVGGVITTADATGVLDLQTADVTRASLSSAGLKINRVDSSSEGGQLDLCRSTDNTSAWAIDVYGNTSTPSLRFVDNVAGAARLIIDGSGYILNGVSSAFNTANYQILFDNSTKNGMAFKCSSTSYNIAAITFLNQAGTQVGYIYPQASSTTYATSSDYRLKENIAPMTGALETVAQLKPVTYKWKADNSDGQGFIAHELQSIVPDAVTGEKDAVDEEGNPIYQGIDTSFLVATLTAAIQELKVIIDTQAERIAVLENKIV